MRYYHYGKKYYLNNVVLEETITLSRKFNVWNHVELYTAFYTCMYYTHVVSYHPNNVLVVVVAE